MYLLAVLTVSAFTSTVALGSAARHILNRKGLIQDLGNKMLRNQDMAYVVSSQGNLQEVTSDEQVMSGSLDEQSKYQEPPVQATQDPHWRVVPSKQALVSPVVMESSAAPPPPPEASPLMQALPPSPPVPAPVAVPQVAAPAEVVALAASPMLQAAVNPITDSATTAVVQLALDPVQPAVVQPAVVQPAAPAVVQAAPTAAPDDEGRGFLGYVFLLIGCLICTLGCASVVVYVVKHHFGLSEHEQFQKMWEAAGFTPIVLPRTSHVPGRMQGETSNVSATKSDAAQTWKTSKENQTYRRSVVMKSQAISDSEEDGDDDAKAAACTGGSGEQRLIDA